MKILIIRNKLTIKSYFEDFSPLICLISNMTEGERDQQLGNDQYDGRSSYCI